ncbi:GNAT family N-acetyltransferase [Woeseia oceani]|uniref:GCN5 family acetyltransferase n=1 Tax=Woeseia oceani TaxID=1548547 RepID=A0A193LF97_9GAMM|nr:GNAT family N-acetyltransferase [Woeseia oceani]ANO51205.1 GCN5 family acetyltransferase [Woeseia oceani]
MNIAVRDARATDAATLVAYNAAMATETEGRQLDLNLLQPGVSAALTDPGKGRYWVAEVNGRIVGQIMVTWEWSDWRNGSMWWIQSVYVHPDFRRRGVFASLYRFVEHQAREDPQCCGLRLYVENDNTSAQHTYRALGMKQPGYQVMEVDFNKATH